MSRDGNALMTWVRRLLCFVGIHDLHLIEVQIAFGPGGKVEKFQCRHCAYVTTRQR